MWYYSEKTEARTDVYSDKSVKVLVNKDLCPAPIAFPHHIGGYWFVCCFKTWPDAFISPNKKFKTLANKMYFWTHANMMLKV